MKPAPATPVRAPVWAVAGAALLHAWALHTWWGPTPLHLNPPHTPRAPTLITRRLELPAQTPSPSPAANAVISAPEPKAAQTTALAPKSSSVSEFVKSVATKKRAKFLPPAVRSEAAPLALPAPEAPIRLSAPSPGVDARPSAARSVVLPPSLQLHFTVLNQQANASIPARQAHALLQWRSDGARYELQLDVERWFGAPRSLSSRGDVSAQGLVPQRYSERGRNEHAAHLDATAGSVRFSSNAAPAAHESGMQDRLSVLMQLSAWIAADPRRVPVGGSLSLPAVGLGGTSLWHFTVAQADPVELPRQVWDGEGTALKLTSRPRHEFDATVEAWFAQTSQPSPWLPVALRLKRPNGDWMMLALADTPPLAGLDMRQPERSRAPVARRGGLDAEDER